jgi:thioredoxin-like negative regulator of GroEL
MTTTRIRRARWALLASAALAAMTLAFAGGDWNDAGVQWLPYDKGVEQAKAQKKPVCLVFYTEWCGHCAKYSAVFHDPRVVEKSKQFVMVRLDRDKNKEVSAKYRPDGDYIPRTYFLMKDAQLDADLHAPREKYRYFYDESAPESILGGMDAALNKFATGAAPAAAPPASAAPADKGSPASAEGAPAPPAKAGASKTP